MKHTFKTVFLCILTVTLTFSCKKEASKKALKEEQKKEKVIPKQELEEIVVSLKNIKSRDSVSVGKRRVYAKKTALYTTFSDSLDIVKKTFLNKTPINETIVYKIPKGKFINVDIDASLEKYSYFLKAGDSLAVSFNEEGLVAKSVLNGSEKSTALLFSQNSIPIKTIEYTKEFLKYYGRVNYERFNAKFDKKFQKKYNEALKRVEDSSSALSPIIYKALKKHLQYTSIENNYSKGVEEEIPVDDFSMSIAAYRNLADHMLNKRSNINYFDDEKEAIEQSMQAIDSLMQDASLKQQPKTRYMILRELIQTVGNYEPNLIPELIAKIPDANIKQQYLKTYTNQYLLALKKYQNDEDNINLVSVKEPKEVFSFQNFLDKNKGKVVYVDLWASWCGPCRKQFGFSHKLKKELGKMPIVFSYFSTDKSFAQWKTAQLEEEMSEEPNSFLILNTKKSKRYNSWNVKGIPRYLIFDKKGKLVVKDAPNPSNPKAKQLLLKYAKID